MAQVQYGDIITEMKGKISGFTFKENYSAKDCHRIVTPRNAHSIKREMAQGKLAFLAGLWRQLTDAQRSDWNIIATTWPFKNCFNIEYFGSGFQVFMSANSNLFLVGLGYHAAGADRVADFVFANVAGTWTNINGTSEISFDNIEALGNWRIYFQCSPILSVGQYHTANRLQNFNYIINTGGVDHWHWEANYNATWNVTAHLLTNVKAMFRIKAINTVTGQHVYAPDLFLNSPV